MAGQLKLTRKDESVSQNNKIKLDETTVKQLIENSEHQSDAVIGVYKMVFPDWEKIEKITDFPTISKSTNEKLFRLFMTFDEKHHPNVIAGGLWMNNGFSSLEGAHLQDWEVDMSTASVKYKE